MLLLDVLNSIVESKMWQEDAHYEEVWKNWLSMLLRLIAFGKHKNPEKIIQEIFDQSHKVALKHHSFISEEVSYYSDFL